MKTEARRQFIHYFFGSMFIVLVALLGVQNTLIILVTGLVLGLITSYFLRKGHKIPLFYQVVSRVEREQEQHFPGKGAFMFFIGAIILMLLFREQFIVIGALCVAIYGDAASTIVGLRFGKHRIAGKKTLEGTLGGVAFSFLFLYFIFPIQIALAACIVGMLAELLPVDDNFTIPLATAATLRLLL